MAQQKTLWIAEDDIDDRLLLEGAYLDLGFTDTLVFFENGHDLLQSLYAATVQLPDLLLMDINMPKMGGREALLELQASEVYNNIPVIIMSTASHEKDREEVLQLGAKQFITKPHHYDDLKAVVSQLHELLLTT